MVFPPIEDVSNDADEFVIATRQHRDVCTGACAFWNVSIQWSRHQDVVEEDEDRCNHTPEQQNDGDAFRIRWVPNIRCVCDHVAEVRHYQDSEQYWEGNEHEEIPPATNPEIVVSRVDELISESGCSMFDVTQQ